MIDLNRWSNQYRHWLLAGLMLLLVYAANQWVLGKGNGFIFDDYSLLVEAKQQSVGEMVNILPKQRYNDRPLRLLAMKIMYQYFKLDFRAYHVVLLLLHLLNAALLYRLVVKLMRALDQPAESWVYLPLITAVIFGAWPRSTFCVQWLSGLVDLLGATIALWVLHLYLEFKKADHQRVFHALLLILFYYAGLRIKEMLLVLPMVLLTYDFFHYSWSAGLTWRAVKKYRPNALLVALFVIMLAYYGYYSQLKGGESIVNQADSPYFYTFSLQVIGRNLLRYLHLYFDYSNFAYVFMGFSVYGISGLAALAAMLGAGVVQVLRARKAVWLPLLGMLMISLAPVLPMKNMQHMLYLYIPSIFISLLLGLGLNRLAGRWVRSGPALLTLNVVAAVLVVSLGWARPVSAFREGWKSISGKNQASIADLQKLTGVEKGTRFYILDATDYENVFFYGPGAVNRLVFDDPTNVTVLNPETIDRRPPYVVLRYQKADGHLTLVED